ncbi:kinetochore complex Sim4 subunit Fta1-domain-containing protein, partial [Peziza echinospora]
KPPTHPLLVRSYQLYRLSPLHNFPSSITSPFKPHERAISNSLRGDVLRGVTVADGDNSDTTAGGKLAGLGRFKACRWRLVPTEWQKAVREREDVAGVEITFEYERGVSGYVAYLLCPPVASPSKSTSKAENGSAFTQFPLLLARLPKALVEVLFEYLTVTFDTLPLPMGLIGGGENNSTYNSTGWLGEMLEMYLSHQKSNGGGKDVTLVFRPPGIQGLKTLTISIRSTEDGDDDEPSKKSKGPFFTAVARYMQGTMGMDMDQLHLTKVACAGFVIGGGGGG